jgi:hypothetical protein
LTRPLIVCCGSSMQTAIDAFEANLLRARSLHALYEAFAKQLTAAIDLSDVLRAAVVWGVSAFDHYVHELTRLGMLECWAGDRKKTDAFNRFPLPISIAEGLANASTAQQAIDAEIRSRHAYLSFLHPEKVADAVRLFSDVQLWDEVGKELGTTSKEIKTSLLLIVDRRNKIAHEADIDPSYPGQRWPISSALVHRAFDTLGAIARAIFKVAA